MINDSACLVMQPIKTNHSLCSHVYQFKHPSVLLFLLRTTEGRPGEHLEPPDLFATLATEPPMLFLVRARVVFPRCPFARPLVEESARNVRNHWSCHVGLLSEVTATGRDPILSPPRGPWRVVNLGGVDGRPQRIWQQSLTVLDFAV